MPAADSEPPVYGRKNPLQPVEELKREAAAQALTHVESGMVLGLGSGSTVWHFLDLLADRVRGGRLQDIRGVPSSRRTAARARELGIPLSTLERSWRLDLTVDGADEIAPDLSLIKGLGGALLREKILAQASRRLAIIADGTKLVARLGSRSPLPVEVVPFGWTIHRSFLAGTGARPVLRVGAEGEPYVTDNGNYIVDCYFPRGIADPRALEQVLRCRVGVVETGLFLDMTTEAFVASETGVRHLSRSALEVDPS